jgi:hypothetical protein
MLRYFREAAELLVELMRTGTKEDAVRLAAIKEVLDRGVGKPVQSVSMDLNIDKQLHSMTVEELQEFRKKYAAIATASPVLIDEVLAGEEDANPELPFGDVAVDGAAPHVADAAADANGDGGDDASGGNIGAGNDGKPRIRHFGFNARGQLVEEDG